jgi:hypothetical protein
MGTQHDDPALIFTSFQNGKPDDVPLDTNSEFYKESRQHSPESYFEFASRVVGGKAYAPNLPPVPGGRIPTDGSFPSFFGLEPLNIFGE